MEVLKDTADVLTEEKYSFTVKQKSWNFLFKKKEVKQQYSIPQLNLFTMIRISKEVMDIDTSVLNSTLINAGMKLLQKHGDVLVNIVAYAVLNGDEKPSQRLLKGIRNMNANDLLQVVSVILKQMNLKSFMTSIISITGVNVIEMNPKEQGS